MDCCIRHSNRVSRFSTLIGVLTVDAEKAVVTMGSRAEATATSTC